MSPKGIFAVFVTITLCSLTAACSRSLPCGPGTHEENGQCVADIVAPSAAAVSVEPRTASVPTPSAGPSEQGTVTKVLQKLVHPDITPGTIEKTIIGKTVGEGFAKWRFAKREPRTIEIIDTKYDGDTAQVVVNMRTNGNSIGNPSRMSGKLRLHFEWIAGEWTMLKVEDLSFAKD